MKSLTTKFALSVLSLVLTGVALSVGIYAWFTINNTAAIDPFNAQVRAGEGMYISLDKTTWKTNVTTAEIVAYLDSKVGGDLDSFRFDAVTSANASTFSKVTYDATDGFGSVAATANSDYLSFDLYFAVSANVDGIRVTTLDVASDPTSWIPTGGTTPMTQSAHNAARVAILNGTDATVFQSEASVAGNLVGFAEEFDANTAANFFVSEYQLDSTAEAAFESLYDQAVLDTVAGIGSTVQFNANYTTPVVVAETFLGSTAGYDVTSITGTIGTDLQIAVLTVNIWVEGWDPQAFNAILSGILSVEFAFDAYLAD